MVKKTGNFWVSKSVQPLIFMFKEALLLLLKVFAGSYIVIGLSNYSTIGQTETLYKTGVTALGTALLWVTNSYANEVYQSRYSWIKTPVTRLVINLVISVLSTVVVWSLIVSLWNAPWKGFDPSIPIRYFSPSNILMTFFITIFITIFMHGRSFLLEWRNAASEAERLKKEQVAAQYESLKNQVNPHFLFNSLNVLTALVHKDADQAELFIRQLSKVYRYVLESRDNETVSLEDEIKQLEAYIFLLKIRFGDSFNATVEVQSLDQRVAPLTLQMLVENAVKHNETSRNNPLYVTIKEENDSIVVCNNLQLKSIVSDSSGVGLSNIRARYGFLTNRPVETENTGDTFCVRVPLVATQTGLIL